VTYSWSEIRNRNLLQAFIIPKQNVAHEGDLCQSDYLNLILGSEVVKGVTAVVRSQLAEHQRPEKVHVISRSTLPITVNAKV
jgi:hypothetical protein